MLSRSSYDNRDRRRVVGERERDLYFQVMAITVEDINLVY